MSSVFGFVWVSSLLMQSLYFWGVRSRVFWMSLGRSPLIRSFQTVSVVIRVCSAIAFSSLWRSTAVSMILSTFLGSFSI